MQEYINFVEDKLEKFQKYTKLIRDEEVTPLALNTVLAEYGQIQIALTSEYARAKINLREIKKQYQNWYDKAFSEIRKKMISETSSKSIKISVKEIEVEVRLQYSQDYEKWNDLVELEDLKVSHLRRLTENWKGYESILKMLQSNMKTDLWALNVVSRFNKEEDNSNNRVRKLKKLEE